MTLFKKSLLSLLISPFFLANAETGLSATPTDFSLAQLSTQLTQVQEDKKTEHFETALVKALQAELISQLKTLQMSFAQLGFKLNKLSFKSSTEKEVAIEYVSSLKEELDLIIKQFSISITPEELLGLTVYITVMADQFERTLKNELRSIAEADTSMIARSMEQTPTLEELTQQIEKNNIKIGTFSEKIATLNLNIFQKGYIKCAYRWNKPLFTIPGLENGNIYISTLLKKCAVYGSVTALAVHNIPEEHLETITPSWLNTFLKKIKGFVGSAAYTIKKSSEVSYPVAEPVSTGYTTASGNAFFIKKSDGRYLHWQTMKTMPAYFNPESTPGLHPTQFAKFSENGFSLEAQQPFDGNVFFLNTPTDATPRVTIAQSHDGSTVPNGFVGKIEQAMEWIVNPGIGGSFGFNLGLGALLAHYVYEDVKAIKDALPRLTSYIHARLSGNKDGLNYSIETPTETFDDVVGREGIKGQLQPFIDFMTNPQQMIDAGITLPRGVILAGEPQTGKTFMVKAMAGEMTKAIKASGKNEEVKLFTVPLQVFLKEGFAWLQNIAEAFTPCIIFCDEFDLMQLERTGNTAHLAEALAVLGGASAPSDPSKFVLFMVATNRIEDIDPALLADGRLSIKLYFENPCFADRKEYLTKFFTKKLINYATFDLDRLVQETENCSYGTIDLFTKGIIASAAQDNEAVSQKHVEKALNSCVKNIIYEDYDLGKDQRHAIAIRFATKTLTALLLHPDKEFSLATILKKNNPVKEQGKKQIYNETIDVSKKGVSIGGIFCYNTKDIAGIVSINEMLKECLIHLAGTIGQQIVDIDYVTYMEDEQIAQNIITKILFADRAQDTLPDAIREQKIQQAYEIIAECKKMLRSMLAPYKDTINNIAQLLEKQLIIRTEDVLPLLNLTAQDYAQQPCALQLHSFINTHLI